MFQQLFTGLEFKDASKQAKVGQSTVASEIGFRLEHFKILR